MSLAVDWDSQNLYWVGSEENRAELARTDGTSQRVLHSGMINLSGLALDPEHMYMYVYVCLRVLLHVLRSMYMWACMNYVAPYATYFWLSTYMYVYVYTYVYVHICPHTHTHTRTHIHPYTHTPIHAYTHTNRSQDITICCIHVHVRTYIRMCMYMYA